MPKACCPPRSTNGKTVGISGADCDEIKQQIPSVEAWLGRKYRRDLGRARPEVQDQVKREEQAAKEGRKLSRHEKKVSTAALQSGWRNMESSLCNFFSFWQILDGSKPNIDMVLNFQKVEAWTEGSSATILVATLSATSASM